MAAVDKGRGRLRVLHGVLYAHFPKNVIKPMCVEIMRILSESADDHQIDCRQLDAMAESAFSLIPDLIRKYS